MLEQAVSSLVGSIGIPKVSHGDRMDTKSIKYKAKTGRLREKAISAKMEGNEHRAMKLNKKVSRRVSKSAYTGPM